MQIYVYEVKEIYKKSLTSQKEADKIQVYSLIGFAIKQNKYN